MNEEKETAEAVETAETPAETPKTTRRRFEWKRIDVKVLYRTWWRHGSGNCLLRSEILEETRRVRVPVEDAGETGVSE